MDEIDKKLATIEKAISAIKENMATKEDMKTMATKEDMKILESKLLDRMEESQMEIICYANFHFSSFANFEFSRLKGC